MQPVRERESVALSKDPCTAGAGRTAKRNSHNAIDRFVLSE
jgi:hypothetical protein